MWNQEETETRVQKRQRLFQKPLQLVEEAHFCVGRREAPGGADHKRAFQGPLACTSAVHSCCMIDGQLPSLSTSSSLCLSTEEKSPRRPSSDLLCSQLCIRTVWAAPLQTAPPLKKSTGHMGNNRSGAVFLEHLHSSLFSVDSSLLSPHHIFISFPLKSSETHS